MEYLPSYPNQVSGDYVVNGALSFARYLTMYDKLYYKAGNRDYNLGRALGSIETAVIWLDADKDRAMAAENEIRFLYGAYTR